MKKHEAEKPRLTLLEGPAGSGKTYECLLELEEEISKAKDPLENNLLFLLPTSEHRERIVDVLLRKGAPGFFNRLVTTFDDALGSFLKLGKVNFVSDVTRYLILKDLIAESKFEYFQEAARTKGFVSLLSNLVRELKESLLTADDLVKRFHALEKTFPVAKEKYSELLSLFKAYEKRLLNAGLKDRHDGLFLLEEGLKRGEWHAPHFKKIWIDGFFDFSKLQLAFIQFLSHHADEIVITLTFDAKRSSLFKISNETREALLAMGFTPKTLPHKSNRTEESALIHLEKNLFPDGNPKEIEPDPAIQIFEATGITGEMEMTAREIKKIMQAGDNINFSDIALIFRRLGAYTGIIRSVFLKFGIPIEIHEREELRLNPLARTVISFFQIFLNDWQREDVFNFLKSSFVKRDYKTICEAEITASRKGVFKGREHWLKTFDIPEIKMLAEFHTEFEGLKNIAGFIRFAKGALQAFNINKLRTDLSEENKRNHAALKRIYLLLEEMHLKYDDSAFEPVRLAEIFLQLIEVDLFSFHHRDKNKVQVYNVSLARQKEYKVVFLPDLLEKEFPVQIKEDPMLSDSERRAFNDKEDILKERLPRQAVERFLFYMGVTRAKEKLFLTYPRFDLEGKEALPSFYVDEVNALFGGKIYKTKQPISEVLPDLGNAVRENEAFAHVIYHLWQVPDKQNSEKEKIYASLYNQFLKRKNFKHLISRLLVPIEGAISNPDIIPQIKPKDSVYTPTKLEEYAECPYRYFSDQVLRLQSFEDTIDLRVVGSILHRVLERFHILANEKHGKIEIETAKKICDEFLEEELELNPLLGDRWYKIELKKREIRETIHQVLIQELVKAKPPIAGLRPEYFEYKFGFKEGAEPLWIETANGKVAFRGQIDRIDIDETKKFGLVIDYKLGKSFDKRALQNGTELQLPLYILAMQQNLGLEPLGAHLYQLSSATSKGFHHKTNLQQAGVETKKHNQLSGEEWNELFENVHGYTERFVGEIEKGKIPVRPRNCVDFCPYSSVCRIEKWRLPDIYQEIEEEDEKLRKKKAHERV